MSEQISADSALRVAVAPTHHDWYRGMVQAVTVAGAEVVEPAEAEALVWLGKHGDLITEHLHAGIRWVQLHSHGVDYWVRTGELDDDRLFTSAKGAYSRSVAEHAVALVLAGARNLPICARLSHWDPALGEGRVVQGSTIGLIGAGGIARYVIDYLRPMDVNLIAVTRSGRVVDGADEYYPASHLDEVWARLDYAVLLAPATPETHSMVDRSVLEKMPEHAWVVNLSRGSLIDTDALVWAVEQGQIGGAALDVTNPEPLPTGHPLWDFPNVLITPHAANPQRNQQQRFLEAFVTENVRRFIRGETPLGVVDVGLGY